LSPKSSLVADKHWPSRPITKSDHDSSEIIEGTRVVDDDAPVANCI
jgi:hypothetical protein